MKINPETEFFKSLIELQYGQKVEDKLKKISKDISWARGWPDDKKAFWNAEAFMWSHKIDKVKRLFIEEELQFLQNGNNLDLGCGSYSYLPSVGFDLSEMMLKLNDNCQEKVVGDLEKPLPFPDDKFDSVTAVFVFNYVGNYQRLLIEIKRVLKEKGIFLMILSSKKINDWQRQKEINEFSLLRWKRILQKSGFKVDCFEKADLLFLKCKIL